MNSSTLDSSDPMSVFSVLQDQIAHLAAARSGALAVRSKFAAFVDIQDRAIADLKVRTEENRVKAEQLLECASSLKEAAAKSEKHHAAELQHLSQSLDLAAKERDRFESSLCLAVNIKQSYLYLYSFTAHFLLGGGTEDGGRRAL